MVAAEPCTVSWAKFSKEDDRAAVQRDQQAVEAFLQGGVDKVWSHLAASCGKVLTDFFRSCDATSTDIPESDATAPTDAADASVESFASEDGIRKYGMQRGKVVSCISALQFVPSIFAGKKVRAEDPSKRLLASLCVCPKSKFTNAQPRQRLVSCE